MKIIKEHLADLLPICFILLAIHFFSIGWHKTSIAFISIPLSMFLVPTFFVMKGMISSRKIFLPPIVKMSYQYKDLKTYFVVKNILIYGIYFFLCFNFYEAINSKQFHMYFEIVSNGLAIALTSVIFICAIYDSIIIYGAFRKKILALYKETDIK